MRDSTTQRRVRPDQGALREALGVSDVASPPDNVSEIVESLPLAIDSLLATLSNLDDRVHALGVSQEALVGLVGQLLGDVRGPEVRDQRDAMRFVEELTSAVEELRSETAELRTATVSSADSGGPTPSHSDARTSPERSLRERAQLRLTKTRSRGRDLTE